MNYNGEYKSSSGFYALTFVLVRYLIKHRNGLSMHPNRYCFYTLLYAVTILLYVLELYENLQ